MARKKKDGTPAKSKDERPAGTIRTVIVKPFDASVSWTELGDILRAISDTTAPVMNNAMHELVMAFEESRRRPAAEGDTKPPSPQTMSYRHVTAFWADRMARLQAIKQRTKRENQELTYSGMVGSLVRLGTATRLFAVYTKWAKERRSSTPTAVPIFKNGQPIYVTGDGVKLQEEDGRYVLSLTLFGKGYDHVDLVLKVDGGHAHAQMKRMIANPDDVGDARIVYDDRKRQWQVLISYRFQPRVATGGGVMAIHKGMRCFLAGAIASGTTEGVTFRNPRTIGLADGNDIIAHKNAYTARRRSLGRHKRELGAGATGHGLARREELITRLQDAEARWVDTKAKQIAARVIKLAQQYGVSLIVLDDWTKADLPSTGNDIVDRLIWSFPMEKARTSIEWAAKKAGIETCVQSSAYNSTDCPSCGHRHEAAPLARDPDGRLTAFTCASCKLQRNVDMISVWNMLLKVGAEAPIEADKRVRKEAVEAFKKG